MHTHLCLLIALYNCIGKIAKQFSVNIMISRRWCDACHFNKRPTLYGDSDQLAGIYSHLTIPSKIQLFALVFTFDFTFAFYCSVPCVCVKLLHCRSRSVIKEQHGLHNGHAFGDGARYSSVSVCGKFPSPSDVGRVLYAYYRKCVPISSITERETIPSKHASYMLMISS